MTQELQHKTFWSSEEEKGERPVKLHKRLLGNSELKFVIRCTDWLCWYHYFLRNSLKTLKTFCLELKTQKILMSLFLRQKSKLDLGDATSLNQQEKKHTHVITRIRNNVSATNLVFNTFFYLLHFSTFNSHKLHSEIHFAIRKLCINSNTLAFQRLINRLVIQKPNPTFTFSTHF